MTVKQIRKIVDGMAQGLKGNELDQPIHTALLNFFGGNGSKITDKLADQIRNEYVQHAWDVEDLTGTTTPVDVKAAIAKELKITKPGKAIKKALSKKSVKEAKKIVAAAKAKKAAATPKAKAEGKRTGKDGKVIVAYPKPQGRTRVMFALVLAGASNEDGLTHIQKEFGKSAPTNTSSLGWVRSQLRNNPTRWNGKYGCTSKLMKAVKANKDCGKLDPRLLTELTAGDDEGEE